MNEVHTPILDKLLLESKVYINIEDDKKHISICELCDGYYPETLLDAKGVDDLILELLQLKSLLITTQSLTELN